MKYKISAFVDEEMNEGKTLVALINEVMQVGAEYNAIDFSDCLPHVREEFGNDYLDIIRAIPVHLTQVDFSSNLLNVLSGEELSVFFDHVPAHIKVIDLSSNSFHHSMPALREAIPHLPAGIEKIILKLNVLHEVNFADFLALLLKLNQNIKVIDFGQNIANARLALAQILPDNYNICSIIENNENEVSDPVILEYLQRNQAVVDYPDALKKPFGDLFYATRKLADEKRAAISQAVHTLYHADFELDNPMLTFKNECFAAIGFNRNLSYIVTRTAAAIFITGVVALAVAGLIGGAGLMLGPLVIGTVVAAAGVGMGVGTFAGGLSAYGLFREPPEVALIRQAGSAVTANPLVPPVEFPDFELLPVT